MNVLILKQPTPSGDYREVHFEAVGSCVWLMFQPSDEEDWVGVFGKGSNKHNAVAWHDNAEAFVIAGGRGYIINTQDKSLLYRTEYEFFVNVVAGPERGLFVVSDELYLYGYDVNGKLWKTHRISWDGIRNLVCKGYLVTGEAWGLDKWYEFTLDLSSRQVTGAAYSGPDKQY